MERTVYEIVPNPFYGWNFKCSNSRHVIKYSVEKEEIIRYALEFCKSHYSELIIHDLECKEILRF